MPVLAGTVVGIAEHAFIVSGSLTCYILHANPYGHSSGRISIPQNSARPLLGIYSKCSNSQYRNWKHPRYPSTDESITKVLHIYTMKQNSAVKKNEVIECTVKWIQLEIIILIEVTQTPKDKYYMFSLIFGGQVLSLKYM